MFNFEQWLREHTWWEDADTSFVVISTETGGVEIMSWDGRNIAKGTTLEEACNNYDKR